MAISLAGYTYPPDHGSLIAPEFALQQSIQTWWGTTGAAVKYGGVTTRILSVDVTFRGYSTEAALRLAVATTQSHVMDDDDLIVDGINWGQSSFLGFTPAAPPFKDGSGKHGWVQMGTFRFLQIAF